MEVDLIKLQKKLLRNVPHTVYHYTDCNALLSIIDNNELWATHINFLNDNQEFKCAYDEVIKNIKDSKKQERFAANIEELTEKIGIYVLSFTLKEDDLDQWRGYRGSSQSICIGFDVTKIKGVFFKEKAIKIINKFIEKGCFSNEKKVSLFFPVTYDIGLSVPSLLKDVVTKLNNAVSDSEIENACRQFLMYSPIMKNSSFNNEKEWRVVTFVEHPTFAEALLKPEGVISFRCIGPQMIQYYKLKINTECIKSLKLGPDENSDLTLKSLKMFISSKIPCLGKSLQKSKIPYRSR